jgi:putative intracellular protease/amidase
VFKKTPSIVKNFSVTGFTDSEEVAVGLSSVVPFSVEEMLKGHGAKFLRGPDWQPFIAIDNNGLLITGQNPASAADVAKAVVKKLSS